jgi:hypothetical protein
MTHLKDFQFFTEEKLGMDVDKTVLGLLTERIDSFSILDNFAYWLTNTRTSKNIISNTVARTKIQMVRRFLWSNGIDAKKISRKYLSAIPQTSHEKTIPPIATLVSIVQIMPISLKTFCVFLAALGWRPAEVLSLSSVDIDESREPPLVQLVGTKAEMSGRERSMYLSTEAHNQYKKWMKFKHRPRRISRRDKKGGYDQIFLDPAIRVEHLIFAPYKEKQREFSADYVSRIYRNHNLMFQRTRHSWLFCRAST